MKSKFVAYQFVMRGEGGHELFRSEIHHCEDGSDLVNLFTDFVMAQVVNVGDSFKVERLES